MSKNLEIKKLERDLLDGEVSLILMKLVGEVINGMVTGKVPDTEPYARRIVAHLREQLVGNKS